MGDRTATDTVKLPPQYHDERVYRGPFRDQPMYKIKNGAC